MFRPSTNCAGSKSQLHVWSPAVTSTSSINTRVPVPVLQALRRPLPLATLAEHTEVDPTELAMLLADWEVEGRVERLGGGLYRRV